MTELSKEVLRERWPKIRDEAVRHGVTEAYFKKPMVADVDIRGNTIYILFDHRYKDAARRAGKVENIVLQAIEAVLGKAWGVKFEIVSRQQPAYSVPPLPPPEAPPSSTA